MFTWTRVRTALGYLFTLILMISSVIVVQSQSANEEPSAEGRLSQFYEARRRDLSGGSIYPTYPGDLQSLYPGDEKWDGMYDAMRPYPGEIQTLATDGQSIYAGWYGYVTSIPNEPISFLGAWKDNQWKELANGEYGPIYGTILTLAYQSDQFYVGGFISKASWKDINNIAHWDGTAWDDMAGGVYSTTGGGTVRAIVTSGSDVYAGGTFDHAGGQVINNIARWDGTQWQDIGGGIGGEVTAIAVSGSNIYVGGAFSQPVGSQNANNIAMWDGSKWTALGSGTNGTVYSIAVQGSDVYVGGEFVSAGGKVVNQIARWDGSQWYALGSGFPKISEEYINYVNVSAIKATPEGIYAGGYFETNTSPNRAYSIAFWNGTKWSNLGSGLRQRFGFYTGTLRDIEVLNNQIFAAGSFALAGNNQSNGFATWNNQPEAITYELGSTPVAPGSQIYLMARWFPANSPVQLTIDGKVVDQKIFSDEDGKVYVRLITCATDAEKTYNYTFTYSGGGAQYSIKPASDLLTASGSFTLNKSAAPYAAKWPGNSVPLTDVLLYLPMLQR